MTDAFVEMPMSAQDLYFLIAMHTNVAGNCYCPKTLAGLIGATETDIEILKKKGFIRDLPDGNNDLPGVVNVFGAREADDNG